jgi:hypothetical protein
MRSHFSLAAGLCALIALAGCASTKVTDRERYQGKRLARPDRILVYDFAATAADLPKWAAASDRFAGAPDAHTAEERATGRELGVLVAADLVQQIQKMGLNAVRSSAAPGPKPGDIGLVGYFESIDEDSAAKRVVIGFASGAAQVKIQVEGYQMTELGMRKLGSAALDSRGGTGPMGVPLTVTAATANPIGLEIEGAARRTADAIAEELRDVFKKQAWID